MARTLEFGRASTSANKPVRVCLLFPPVVELSGNLRLRVHGGAAVGTTVDVYSKYAAEGLAVRGDLGGQGASVLTLLDGSNRLAVEGHGAQNGGDDAAYGCRYGTFL
ncbi:hypothetical protein [Streptomyces sp. HPF1205]|uniref:hypothetical protein n=1 Tax=Streptomyces sp. HPF1205 TaxID=2873262 RepID=UPI001CEDE602|nr:hypothetical protein [Streptomyces sp. HPF1205]